MNKSEALAFGVPVERYKEFQETYNRDLASRAKSMRAKEDAANQTTLSAIFAMLKLIKRQDTLEDILKFINKAYFSEV